MHTSSGPTPTARRLLRAQSRLRNVLTAWHRGIKKDNKQAPKFLIYRLVHEYTEASFRLGTLKGLDRMKADSLEKSCSQAGIGFYLAYCEKIESGGCEYSGQRRNGSYHVIQDICESTLKLSRMIDGDGNLLAKNIEVDEGDFIQDSPFDRTPDKEDYQGYMSNWGPDATHFYHDSV